MRSTDIIAYIEASKQRRFEGTDFSISTVEFRYVEFKSKKMTNYAVQRLSDIMCIYFILHSTILVQ